MSSLKRNLSFIVIILGFFMALLDTTIVNITLPEMTKHFNSDVQSISWVMNGYNIAFAVFILTAARLADQYGRKKIFLIGVFVFTLSSFLAGISSSVSMLVFFRVVQGLAGAIVVPVTIPLTTDIFPKEMHGSVMGIWGAVSGLAAAGGPSLGGLLTDSFNWKWIFFVNIPVGIITVILGAILLRESYDTSATRKLDFGGIITISVAMFCVTYALIESRDYGWGSLRIILLFVASAVALILFFINENRTSEPMLPTWLLKIKEFNGASLTIFAIGAGVMSATFLMSFYLTQILGMSELKAGLTIAAMPLTSMLFSAISGPLSSKYGSRWFAVLGMALISFSVYLFSGLDNNSTRGDVIWRLIITGAGLGLAMAPTIGSAIRNVPDEKAGISSGVTNMTRALGAVLGVAILITILNSSVTTEVKKSKAEVISLISRDKILSPELKTSFMTQIKRAKVSQDSTANNSSGIIKSINASEKAQLSKTPAPAKKKVIAAFTLQKKEVQKLWPQIQTDIKVGVSKAFSHTFKFGALILLLGVLFAFFSDKKKDSEAAGDENRTAIYEA